MLDPNTIELPLYAHKPGLNKRPEEGFLDFIIGQAPEETSSETSSTNLPWLYGLRLFKEGYFWEAHEVWEEVWLRARPNSRERFLVQGMIHLANAELKSSLSKDNAAEKLRKRAEESFSRAFPATKGASVMGIDRRTVSGCTNSEI